MKSPTYIIEDKQPILGQTHWDYCWDNSLPYVKVRKATTKYWRLEFNMHPIVKNDRTIILAYSDCLIPIYKAYIDSAGIPEDKFLFGEGDYDCHMMVRKQDAEKLADQLFHLIVLLSKFDQQFFDVAQQ